MLNQPLFDHELRDEIINIFINDPYNTEGHSLANRIHAPDGSVGWPDPKNSKLAKLKDKYGYKKFITTLNILIDSNIIIEEVINEYEVYSLSSKFITEHLVSDPFSNA
ncbi:MAG: hypothetical protein E6Q33_07405 [Neisseriales bacterium]|nr:MAG: hypothetical protein E6Q33_07405 [Neisseriales bacterium]